jgi:hypothetical protein
MKNILWALAGIGLLLYGLDFLDQRGVLTSAAGEHRLDNSEISQVVVGSRITYDLDRLRIFLGSDGKDPSATASLDSSLPDQEFLPDGRIAFIDRRSRQRTFQGKFYKITNDLLSTYSPGQIPRFSDAVGSGQRISPDEASRQYRFEHAYNVYIVREDSSRYRMENRSLLCRLIIHSRFLLPLLPPDNPIGSLSVACMHPFSVVRA